LKVQKRITKVLLFAFFFIAISGIVFAQGEKGNSRKEQIHLSIEDALELALKNNRDLQTARRNLKSAESSYRRAKGSYYPRLTGDITTSHTAFNQLDADPAVQNMYRGGVGINFSLPLDLPGTIGRSVQQSYISLSTSKVSYISACQNMIVNVYTQYYEILRSRETIAIDQAQVKGAEEQLRIAKARLEKGRDPEVDVLTATVQLNNARQTLKRDEGDYLNALTALLNTLGLDHGVEIVATTELKYVPATFDYEAAEKEALQNRVEMKISRLRLESVRISLKSTNDVYRPTLNVSAGWGYDVSGTSYSKAVNERPSEPSWSVTTSLNIPIFIFDGGSIRESKTQAMIDLEQAEADINQTMDSIKLEVKNELTNFENAQERVGIVEDSIKLAEESLKITELRYGLGSSSYLVLVDTRNNLRTTELNLLDALITHSLSKIRVYKAIGKSMVTATGQLIKDK
jgi:outer membrane protein TolC